MIGSELDAVAATTEQLFRAIAAGDVSALRQCYIPAAAYRDPIFGELGPGSARRIWPFILAHTARLRWRFEIKDVGLTSARVRSLAEFEFAPTGRPVALEVLTTLRLRDRIILHDDDFDRVAWAAMALPLGHRIGLWLPGGTSRHRRHARDAFLNSEDFICTPNFPAHHFSRFLCARSL